MFPTHKRNSRDACIQKGKKGKILILFLTFFHLFPIFPSFSIRMFIS